MNPEKNSIRELDEIEINDTTPQFFDYVFMKSRVS